MPADLHFGSYRLAGPQGPLYRHAAEVKLPPKALSVLWLLASRRGQVVTKSALFDEVWTDTAVGEDALAFQIQALRHALDDDARHPRYIATVYRVGYRFVAPVTDVPPGLHASWDAEPAEERGAGPLVGRDAELASLHARFVRAQRGERQTVFVTGEAGIGKTALVEAFLAGIAAGNRLRIGRGYSVQHHGAGEAYLPWLDALARLCRGSDRARLVGILRRHAPACLAQMGAVISEETSQALLRSVQGMTRNRMLRELARGLEAIAADRPLVLLLEDLHWSDTSTVELLTMIARRREPAAVLLIGTYRPVELILTDHPLKHAKQELVGTGRAAEVPLAYLSAEAVQTFVARRLPDAREELAAIVVRRTEGHPLFMVHMTDYLAEQQASWRAMAAGDQMVAALEHALPYRLRELIEAQFSQLPADEQRVLEIASVAGAEFEVASVAAAAQLPMDAVEMTCERLAGRGQFIDDRGLAVWPDGTASGRYGFRHALYPQVVSGRLGAGQRARWMIDIDAARALLKP